MLTELELHPYEMLCGTSVPSQGFADDTALVCSSRAALQQAVDIVGGWTRVHRCGLNAKKSDFYPFQSCVGVDGRTTGEFVEDPLVFATFSRERECIVADTTIHATPADRPVMPSATRRSMHNTSRLKSTSCSMRQSGSGFHSPKCAPPSTLWRCQLLYMQQWKRA
jgi:hypothetical protein